MVYVLIGYWPGETHEQREYRRQKLRVDCGILADTLSARISEGQFCNDIARTIQSHIEQVARRRGIADWKLEDVENVAFEARPEVVTQPGKMDAGQEVYDEELHKVQRVVQNIEALILNVTIVDLLNGREIVYVEGKPQDGSVSAPTQQAAPNVTVVVDQALLANARGGEKPAVKK